MARAQETEDAELVAMAALVFHESVVTQGEIAKYGEPQSDPFTDAVRSLYALLDARGMLAEKGAPRG